MFNSVSAPASVNRTGLNPAASTFNCTSSTTTRQVQIDHLYFPHIIDLIWSYMDYPAVVACAKSSRLWGERAMDYVPHVALIEFEDGSVVLRSRDLEWPEASAILFRPCSFSKVLGGFEVVDIFFNTDDGFKTAFKSNEWPLNYLRYTTYDVWPPFHDFPTPDENEPEEVRSATVFMEYRNGHFFYDTVLAVVPCNITSLTLTVHCYSNPTMSSPLVTTGHVNTLISLFPGLEAVKTFTVILTGSEASDPSIEPDEQGCGCCDIDCAETVLTLASTSLVADCGALCELALLAILMPKLKALYIVGTELFRDVTGGYGYLYWGPFDAALDQEASFNDRPSVSAKIDPMTHKAYEEYVEERRYRLQTEV